MSANPSSSNTPPAASASTKAQDTAYRNPTVQDEDDDDFDDLDDVLDSFNAPKSSLGKHPQETEPSRSAAVPTGPIGGAPAAPPVGNSGNAGGDDEFEASLIQGMESLLRSLANEHPPGPMADDKAGPSGTPAKTGAREATPMSSEEEERAFQKAVEMMLSGEGMDALGMGKGAGTETGTASASAKSPAVPKTGSAAAGTPKQPPTSFDETIRKTMESLNQGGANAGTGSDMPDDIAALLKQLSENPGALDGLGDGDDDDLGGLLDGMMAQLMSKEVLEEPMNELADKYPAYLAKPPAGVSEADLEKYRQQHKLVQKILETFKKPGYTDDVDGKEVAKLVGEMQDLGGPPNEIMGELPDGFDLGALGGQEGCVVM